MIRFFSRPIPLVLLLAFCTFIPILVAAVSAVQIPLGALPEDSLRLMIVAVAFFLHALSGVLFGVLGPMQFVFVMRRRFGALHRVTGRIFVLAGLLAAICRDGARGESATRRATLSLVLSLVLASLFNCALYDALIGDFYCVLLGLLLALAAYPATGDRQRLDTRAA